MAILTRFLFYNFFLILSCFIYPPAYARLEIGVIIPETGYMSEIGKEIRDGQIVGETNFLIQDEKDVDFLYMNSKSRIEDEMLLLKELLANEDIDAIVAATSYEAILLSSKAIKKNKKPIIFISTAGSGKDSKICQPPYVIELGISTNHVVEAIARITREKDFSSATIITENNFFGNEVMDLYGEIQKIAMEYSGEAFDLVNFTLPDSLDISSYGREITKIYNHPTDVIFIINANSTKDNFVRQLIMTDIPDKSSVYIWGNTDDNKSRLPKKMYSRVRFINAYVMSQPGQQNVEFRRSFWRTFGRSPRMHSVYGYDAVKLISIAIRKGTVSKNKKSLFENMRNTYLESPRGSVLINEDGISQDIYVFHFEEDNLEMETKDILVYRKINSFRETCYEE